MAGTHFRGPVMFSSATPALENLNIGDWPDQVKWMDDFTGIAIDTGYEFWGGTYTAGNGNTWAIDQTAGQSQYGVAKYTLAGAAAGDGIGAQSALDWRIPDSEKYMTYHETRLKVSDSATMNWFSGFSIAITDPDSSLMDAGTANYIGFRGITGNDQVQIITSGAGTDLTFMPGSGLNSASVDANLVSLGQMVDDTYKTFGFTIHNQPSSSENFARFYINRKLYGTVTSTGAVNGIQTASTLPANVDMAVTAQQAAGTAVASTAHVDYVLAAADRQVAYRPTN